MQLSLRNKVLLAVGMSGITFILTLSAVVGYRVYLFVESNSIELAPGRSEPVIPLAYFWSKFIIPNKPKSSFIPL